MSQFVIEVDTPEDAALLISILPKFNARVREQSASASPQRLKKSLAETLEAVANQGGLPSFGDGSQWQQAVRSWDKQLDGRDE